MAMMPMMMDSTGIMMLERTAKADVKPADGEEGEDRGDEQQVGHGGGG